MWRSLSSWHIPSCFETLRPIYESPEADCMRDNIFEFPALERVVYGKPAAPALAAEVERIGARRVFLVVSGTMNRTTDEVEKVRAALGSRYRRHVRRHPAFHAAFGGAGSRATRPFRRHRSRRDLRRRLGDRGGQDGPAVSSARHHRCGRLRPVSRDHPCGRHARHAAVRGAAHRPDRHTDDAFGGRAHDRAAAPRTSA